MSGGRYDYVYSKIEQMADDIQEVGQEHAAPQALREAFRQHLRKVAAACRAIEWNDSSDGDSDEEKLIREVLGEARCTEAVIQSACDARDRLNEEINRANKWLRKDP